MQRVRNVRKPNAAVMAAMEGVPQVTTAVVAESELQRMYDIVEDRAAREAQARADRADQLREASRSRMANWPNTIEALRIRKERARQERLDQEEARRREIDEQEAKLKAAKQELAIRKANVLLYEQNDRIKTFSSKLFMASVLDEREKQLQMKKEKEARDAEVDRHWTLVEAEEKRKAEKAEGDKRSRAQQQMYELKDAQLQQLADIRTSKIADRDERMAEGMAIKSAAAASILEERDAEERRKAGQRQHMMDLVEANKEHKVWRQKRRDEEAEEGKRIDAFATKKEEQAAALRRRQQEKFDDKMSHRQKLIDRQAETLAEMQAATEEREMRAMRDFGKERDERERREREQRDSRQREIEEFRSKQRERKARVGARQEAERQRSQAAWKLQSERLIEEDLEEARQRRVDGQRNQHILLLQAQEKREQAARAKRADLEEGVMQQRALQQEQEDYENYVNTVMHDYVVSGRGGQIVQMASRRSARLPGESSTMKTL